MGYVYTRKDSSRFWMAYKNAAGQRVLKNTKQTERADAEKVLAAMERKVRAQVEANKINAHSRLVKDYAARWLDNREAQGLTSIKEDRSRMKRIVHRFGGLLLEDVTREDVKLWVRAMGHEKVPLSSRHIRNTYDTLRVMLSDAQADGLIDANPCTLRERRKELPQQADKTAAWRDSAVYSHAEVRALICDERIPRERRVTYALLFLTGMRNGEMVVRRWSDLDESKKPLGELAVGSTWLEKLKREKVGTKTGIRRRVPVHPTLAVILADWRKTSARTAPTDFIVWSPRGRMLKQNNVLLTLKADLRLLGLSKRRVHDTRRTFISLGISDGARGDILRWVSHGTSRNVFDVYTTVSWEALCAEVAKLNISACYANATEG